MRHAGSQLVSLAIGKLHQKTIRLILSAIFIPACVLVALLLKSDNVFLPTKATGSQTCLRKYIDP